MTPFLTRLKNFHRPPVGWELLNSGIVAFLWVESKIKAFETELPTNGLSYYSAIFISNFDRCLKWLIEEFRLRHPDFSSLRCDIVQTGNRRGLYGASKPPTELRLRTTSLEIKYTQRSLFE